MSTIREIQQTIEALNREAVSLARLGEIDAAENVWLQVLALDPDVVPVRTNLARLYFQAGRYRDVLNLCEPLRGRPEVNAALAALVGQASLCCSRPTVALQWLTIADRLRPNDPGLLLSLSEALLGSGRLDEAANLLESLVHAFPGLLEPLLNLAVVYTESGKLERASALYEQLESRWQQNPQVLANAGRFHLNHGRHDDALSRVQTLFSSQPQSRQSRFLLAEVLRAGGDHVRACQLWQQLLDEDPEDLEARLPLIYSALEQLDWQTAAVHANSALSHLHDVPSTRLLAALVDLPKQAKDLLPAFNDFLEPADLVVQQQMYETDDPLLDQLQAVLRSQSSLVEDRPGKPTRGGLQSHELFDRDRDSSIRLLTENLKHRVQSYCQHLQRRFPSLCLALSDDLSFSGWGVVLRSGGRQLRHTHPEAVISGVIYLQVPECVLGSQSDQGCLWFSPNPLFPHDQPGLKIKPLPGLLILFPSFVPHETIAFDSLQERVCIAFNVS